MKISIGIQGSTGRTGKLILEVLNEYPDIKLSKLRNFDGSITELSDGSSVDLWIDFSAPEATLQLLDIAIKSNSGMLIGTTGFSEEQLAVLKEASQYIPIMVVQNTSLGVYALKEITAKACQILGADWDIEIVESHHKMKKDSPSGTACLLLDTIKSSLKSETSLEPIYDRTNRKHARENNEIGISAIRGGDIAGEHTVFFIGNGERIELTHRATDRKIFARGALKLAGKLANKPKGWYLLDNL